MPALFVSYAGLLGGAERIMLDVAIGLEETPTLACPDGPLSARARDTGLHVIALRERPLEVRASVRDRLSAPLRVAALGRELRGIVAALNPEAVFAWGMRAALAATALGRSRPALVFQHNDLLPGPLIGRAVVAAAGRADRIVALSSCAASELGRDVEVIHPGVDLAHFAPTAAPQNGGEVLVLGAIVPWKQPLLALEAVALARRERPDLRLQVAGAPIGPDGERLLADLQGRAERPDLAGRVEFAGSVDAATALGKANCLLHCAPREPFGLVLAEALACGRPVVAPAACGPLEIVDEGCGRLYRPGDAAAAARALLEALERADELGAAGRERAERLFDIERFRRQYRELMPTPKRRSPAPGTGIALVTVTHNSERDVLTLLSSVRRHLPGARVVVVDSGSTDRSAALAREAGAHVIELGENVGFGRASNVGVAHVNERVTILVNPDVELVDDSLARIPDELELSDRILAPVVLRPNGERQDSAQAEPGSAAALAIALVPPALMPAPLRRAASPWTADKPRRVAWAVGCCLAARTDTLKRLGPFDECIFMYGEDLELGLRAGDEGVETWFWPQARVIHRSAHSTDPAYGGEPFELLAEQRRKVVAERRGPGRARRDNALQALTFADRIALKTLAGRGTARERKQLRALWHR
jgi:N-acetylglucosaminyl-diphospho-decaprenol L-rhamnosyltransferase